MPDIQMCAGKHNDEVCKMRSYCYRYTAQPNSYWQAYGPVGDKFTAKGGCVNFMRNREVNNGLVCADKN